MYTGHLLIVPPAWLAAVPVARGGFAYAGCRGGVREWFCAGDPVFLLRDGDAEHVVRAHGCVCGKEHMPRDAARAKFGDRLALCGDPSLLQLYTAGPHPGAMSIDVLYLGQILPVEPTLALHGMGIAPPGRSGVREVEPEEVLTLLAGLPATAQTAWSRRVVARNNDFRPPHDRNTSG